MVNPHSKHDVVQDCMPLGSSLRDRLLRNIREAKDLSSPDNEDVLAIMEELVLLNGDKLMVDYVKNSE